MKTLMQNFAGKCCDVSAFAAVGFGIITENLPLISGLAGLVYIGFQIRNSYLDSQIKKEQLEDLRNDEK